MEQQSQVVVAGFREMWHPVYSKYKPFFDCAFKLQSIVSEMISASVFGFRQIIISRNLGFAIV